MRDLIIVGAGPAGSHLAKGFAGKGKDVLVIEQSDEIGRPLACSGHVSPDIWDFVPPGSRERLLQNDVRGAEFHARDDSRYRFFSQETVSHVIDRVELDRVKAEQAMEAGVDYHMDEHVESVTERDDRVEVSTDSDVYEARMVAGCDGASSTVRDSLGMEGPDHFYQGILCFSDEEDSSDFVDVFLEVPEFFGWRIPRGDSVEYGAAVPRGENPVEWLDSITEGYIEKEEKQNICAGAIPVGPPESVTSERVFLVGDAAGQTKPFTGGGILYGMRSAQAAVEAIELDDPETLENYEEKWRSELGREIALGGFIEKMYSMPSPLQKLGMKLFEGEIGVHMDRPSTVFSLSQLKKMLF
ncbi:MAG: geranylgeranyl reductase family protein [Candidatus Nanohaloarchaea archaeon]